METEANWPKKFITVNGLSMAYVERGEGISVVFVHGNPTSSYLWRNILPELSEQYRCLALDLIGMGDSAKLPLSGPGSYTLVQHQEYFDAAMEQLIGDMPVVLVVHDWGSALGFDWARRHAHLVCGIAYMEAIVCPLHSEDFPEAASPIFQAFRSDSGEAMILERNLFVERVLPASIQRKLTEQEFAEYRRPFLAPGESRRATLTWPRQIPIDGLPEDVASIVSVYGEWLQSDRVPKLFINADPGAILVGRQRKFCRSWPNQIEITVSGLHFIQEDSASEIASALGDWVDTLQLDTA